MPDPRSMPRRYHGSRNALIVRREDREELKDLYQPLNMPPLGGPNSALYKRITKAAEAASHQLPPLVNVLFRGPLMFSCSYGERAVGQGYDEIGHFFTGRIRAPRRGFLVS